MSGHVQAWWGEKRYYEVYSYDSKSDQFVNSGEVIGDPNAPDPDHRLNEINPLDWDWYVKIGKLFGWQPMGTSLKYIDEKILRENPQVGCTNDYTPINYDYAFTKMVYAEDAAAWASALEKALAQLEAGPITIEPRFTYLPEQKKYAHVDTRFAKFGEFKANLDHLTEFVTFLKQGQFKFAIHQSVWD